MTQSQKEMMSQKDIGSVLGHPSFASPAMRPVIRIICIGVMSLASLAGYEAVSAPVKTDHAGEDRVIAYQTIIEPTGQKTVDDGMAAVSQLVALGRTHDVEPYALAGRIRADYDRLQGALRSRGYYDGRIIVTVTGLPDGKAIDGLDPLLAPKLARSREGQKLTLHIHASLGPIFSVGRILFLPLLTGQKEADGQVSTKAQKEEQPEVKPEFVLTAEEKTVFGIKPGDHAVAADILAAQGRLLTLMQEEGYALASLSTPQAIVHKQVREIDVRFHADRGSKVAIGNISITGLHHVREDYVRNRLILREGQLYQPSAIEAARVDVNRRGLFSSVQVRNQPPLQKLPKGISAPGNVHDDMPLSFDFVEGKRYNISGNAGYSTDLGGRAGISWLDRNLMGRGESLRLSAMATGLGGTAQQGQGYDILADFNKPDFMQRDRILNLHAEAIKQLFYSYHQTAWFSRAGFSQPLTRRWTGGVAASIEQERIRQFGSTSDYFIIALPLQVHYDSTDKKTPIESATRGIRVHLGVTPSESMEHRNEFFLIMSGQISGYMDLAQFGIGRKKENSILALRGSVGSIQGATTWKLPPDQRLYAGGPATIRGYRYQGVGPQHGKYAIGGTSMDAATIELRQRLYHDIGMALFSDAGQVGRNSLPGHGKLRVGYGGGLRYFTPIGPVRVDVAFPTKRVPRGDRWELYIGLGETF